MENGSGVHAAHPPYPVGIATFPHLCIIYSLGQEYVHQLTPKTNVEAKPITATFLACSEKLRLYLSPSRVTGSELCFKTMGHRDLRSSGMLRNVNWEITILGTDYRSKCFLDCLTHNHLEPEFYI